MSEKWKPKAYMKRAVKHVETNASAGLFLDPGMCKTSITYKAISNMFAEKRIKRVLVFAPLRPAYSVWPAEQEKWTDFHHLRVQVLHDKKAKNREEKFLRNDIDVDVINYDALKWLVELIHKHRRFPWDMLVCDESTKLKNTRSQRFKMLKPWLPKFKRRLLLTGTPASNGLLDLFGQAYVMDLGEAFGPYITHFRFKYFLQTGYMGYVWVPKKGAAEAIYARLADKVLRLDAADHLDLPPLIINDIKLDMPEDARRAYDAMEEDLIAQVDGEVITAKTAATAAMSCRQMANGGIYTGPDHSKDFKNVHNTKTEALLEIMEELNGKPLLIAYEFHHDLARLREALGKDLPYIGGNVSPKKSKQLEDAWNATELPALAVHYASVAHGLNLQAAKMSALCCYSLTWDLELYLQIIRRLYRQGRISRVVVHRLIMRKTVDEVQVAALKSKDKTQRSLFKALQDYAKARV